MMKLWTLVAVAAMGFVACQNNFEESATNSPSNSVVVKFISEEARTSVDTSGDAPVFSWSESDTFEVLEQTDALAKATSVNYTMADGRHISMPSSQQTQARVPISISLSTLQVALFRPRASTM